MHELAKHWGSQDGRMVSDPVLHRHNRFLIGKDNLVVSLPAQFFFPFFLFSWGQTSIDGLVYLTLKRESTLTRSFGAFNKAA